MEVWEILLEEEKIEEERKEKIKKFIKENPFKPNESFILASLIKEAKKLNDKEFDLYLKIHKKRKCREKNEA